MECNQNNTGTPLVSVVIPAFNMARFIAASVRSALSQTYPCTEIIVIDDGSIDNTYSILLPYIDDGSIEYHYQDNSGLSAARNAGIACSRGDYVALLDADDIWEPSKLALQVAKFSGTPEVGLVFSDFATFDDSGTIAARKASVIIEQIPEPDFEVMIRRNNFIYPSTVLIRKSVFDKCGPFDVNLQSIEDYDMWLRIAEKFRIIGINEPLVMIRQHSSNMSKNIPRMLENEVAVINKHRAKLSDFAYKKRIAKALLLSADRSIHNGDRPGAIKYMMRAIVTKCAPAIDLFVVILKLILGGACIESIRRMIRDDGSIISKAYNIIYKRY